MTEGTQKLTCEEHELLASFIKEDKPVMRAVIILLHFIAAMPKTQIAQLFMITRQTVAKDIQRFRNERGITSFFDKPRSGRSPKILRKIANFIIKLVSPSVQPIKFGFIANFWTCAMIAYAVFKKFCIKLHQNTIRAFLHKLSYGFSRPKLKTSTKGKKKGKTRIQKAISLGKKGKAHVFFLDQTCFRLLPLVRGMWMKVGQVLEIVVPYHWNVYFYVYGAVDILTGQFIWDFFEDKINQSKIISFLEKLLQQYGDEQPIYLIWDRATYHRGKELKQWLKRVNKERCYKIRILFLPPNSPKLNPVESLWRVAKDKVAANKTYESIEQIQQIALEFFKTLTLQKVFQIVCRRFYV